MREPETDAEFRAVFTQVFECLGKKQGSLCGLLAVVTKLAGRQLMCVLCDGTVGNGGCWWCADPVDHPAFRTE